MFIKLEIVRLTEMERFGPTRRGGPVFRWLGEPLAIDLANTVMVVREGESVDLLATEGELVHWLKLERPRLGRCEFALESANELRTAREDIRSLFTASAANAQLPREAVSRLNALSRRAPVSPQLQVADEGEPNLTEGPEEPHNMAQLLGCLARSAFRIVVADHEAPIGLCDAPSCGMFFIGRRRWCCAACGNRARAAKHYRKTRRSRSSRTIPHSGPMR